MDHQETKENWEKQVLQALMDLLDDKVNKETGAFLALLVYLVKVLQRVHKESLAWQANKVLLASLAPEVNKDSLVKLDILD